MENNENNEENVHQEILKLVDEILGKDASEEIKDYAIALSTDMIHAMIIMNACNKKNINPGISFEVWKTITNKNVKLTAFIMISYPKELITLLLMLPSEMRKEIVDSIKQKHEKVMIELNAEKLLREAIEEANNN